MMINAISPIASAQTSNAAPATWGSNGKLAESEASPALPVGTVSSTSGSQASSAADTSSTNATSSRAENQATSGAESAGENKEAGTQELTPQQQSEVVQLKQRDEEVHAHEQAHQSAGAGLTGAASYTYTTGPDGKRYATGGEVSIDASPVNNNPSQTISKMEKVIAAALAPADPSSQDRAVANAARGTMVSAEMALMQQRRYDSSSQVGSTIDTVA